MNDSPLLLTTAARWSAVKIRENKVPLTASLLVGLMCYVYAFTNKLLNHDEVFNLFGKGATVTSGRWALGALDAIFPNYSMPWVNGIMTLVFLSIAVCLMVRLLSIHSKTLQALLAGTVIAFPSLIGTFAYMFTSNSFGLSFLLAVLAVWFVCQNRILYWIPAIGCMVFSLGIYQSYISIAAGLLVLVLIRQLLTGTEAITLLKRGVLHVLFLIISLGLYYIATEVALVLKDEVLNEYANDNVSFSLSTLPATVALAYHSFFRFFTEGYQGLIPTDFSRLLHLVLAGVLLLLLVISAPKKEWEKTLLLTVLVVIFPLTVCCMYLFTTADSIHTLVLYGFVNVYALTALAADVCMEKNACKWQSLGSRIGGNLVTFVLLLIILCNMFLANQVWLNLQLRYEHAYAFYSALLADLRRTPEFTEDMPIALVGDYPEAAFYQKEFPFCEVLTGTKGFKPDSYSNEEFFTYYLGISLPFTPEHICEELSALPEVIQMPCYPYYGSVQVIDRTVVVKLS